MGEFQPETNRRVPRGVKTASRRPRRGVLVEDMGQTYLAEPDADGEEARTLRPLQTVAVTYRIAFELRAGQKALALGGAMPREDWVRQPLCADIDGFVSVRYPPSLDGGG